MKKFVGGLVSARESSAFLILSLIIAFLCLASPRAMRRAEAAEFVPIQPTVPASALRAGNSGYMLTVLRGMEPTRIPIEVVSVLPQNQKGAVKDLILIRMLPLGGRRGREAKAPKLARGMSGSPVYVRSARGGYRLAGAVGSGWDFSDHTLALVTPIADMCNLFSKGREGRTKADISPSTPLLSAPIAVSGLSGASATRLGQALGLPLAEAPMGAKGELRVEPGELRPGDSVAAVLAWGDVDVAATGVVTATSKDGRFLAFGHPFLKRGDVGYPAARAYIHDTVQSQSFPFKLASPLSIMGTFTQDREAGVGGRAGFFAPSISAALVFKDRDKGSRDERRFRVVSDTFLSAKLLEAIYAGLLEDAWGRKGQGTMTVTLRIEGRGVPNGWTRSDVFFSDEDVGIMALRQASQIMNSFLTQPFADGMPMGFRLDVEASEEPRALLIEDVEAPTEAHPGEEMTVKITLRQWRGRTFTRDFTLKVPEGASGVCELIVRGGGVQPMPQLALDGGWKSIDSLDRLLTEIAALDANNELFIELHTDSIAEALRKGKEKAKAVKTQHDLRGSKESEGKGEKKNEKKSASEGLLAEEKEYLSETKERRISEGNLKIFRADRFVDGMMKRLITI